MSDREKRVSNGGHEDATPKEWLNRRSLGAGCHPIIFPRVAHPFRLSRVITLHRRVTEAEADDEEERPHDEEIFAVERRL